LFALKSDDGDDDDDDDDNDDDDDDNDDSFRKTYNYVFYILKKLNWILFLNDILYVIRHRLFYIKYGWQ
jgi:hypothetical protein